MTVTIKGSDEFRARLKGMGQAALPALAEALTLEFEAVIEDAKENYVPTVSTNLKGSGHVNAPVLTPGSVMVKGGFGNAAYKYAKKVHDNPRAGKTGGFSPRGRRYKEWSRVGSWKYLTKPLHRRARGLERRVWNTIERFWRPILSQ
jgi:hypothetical protein